MRWEHLRNDSQRRTNQLEEDLPVTKHCLILKGVIMSYIIRSSFSSWAYKTSPTKGPDTNRPTINMQPECKESKAVAKTGTFTQEIRGRTVVEESLDVDGGVFRNIWSSGW